jgi:hypothetical protein
LKDLFRLLQDNLPTGLSLAHLLRNKKTTVILDAANEIPRLFVDNGRWLTDAKELLLSWPDCRFIIGSRNETWLTELELPRFNISDIDSDFVTDQLSHASSLDIKKNPELLKTLSKPLFFSLASSRKIDLQRIKTPADVYTNFFEIIDERWHQATNPEINFAEILHSIGFGMLTDGLEFANKQTFEAALEKKLGIEGVEKALSFLLAEGVLIPLTERRLSFFHQSVTEFLAAKVIAAEFRANELSLRTRLQDKRWDQALFLATSFLEDEERRAFVDKVLSADLSAAARAAHYLEHGQEELINEIARRASQLPPFNPLMTSPTWDD